MEIDEAGKSAWNAAKVRWLETQLEEAGVLSPSEIDDFLSLFAQRAQHLNGRKIVARAWVDPFFKTRLLRDGNQGVNELGLGLGSGGSPGSPGLTVLENRVGVHHVIVCTLCSCYPLNLLGPSPSWYKSSWYRAEVVRRPRSVLKEFGLVLPPNTQVTVVDSTAEMRYMVLPVRPPDTEHMSEVELQRLVTRNGLIGTAVV